MDHPRSRGVYAAAAGAKTPTDGSSPLARGLPHRERDLRLGQRIIPARAGFTSRSAGRETRWADHPRSRGVYGASVTVSGATHGSSPLARGLRGDPDLRLPHRGIIPARAGFTPRPPATAGAPGDHPRSRGVYTADDASRSMSDGSSPLARGLRVGEAPRGVGGGIIPARAGFTSRRRRSGGSSGDHPRSRGVYGLFRALGMQHLGSSPLARGLRAPARPGRRRTRIIPARAGFTGTTSRADGTSWDHPRSRGVYLWPVARGRSSGGSSPLARGLRLSLFDWLVGADHPRSRGVYDAARQEAVRALGSSPLARGLRAVLGRSARPRWIIPARAGFTRRRLPAVRHPGDHPRSRGVYDQAGRQRPDRRGSSPLARGLHPL